MTTYNICPRGPRVLIQSKKQEQTTAGGIVLPEQGLETYNYGIVLEVGDEVKDINIGDTVMYSPFAGTRITQDERKIIVDERDIIAIMKEQDDG